MKDMYVIQLFSTAGRLSE